jgi:hypothetical protein
MKQITELSEQEVLALTQEQLTRMVKLRMAEQGIKMIDEPTEPSYEVLPEKTEQWYSIKGCDYITQDKEFAETLGLILKKSALKFGNYSYVGNDYTHKVAKRLDDYAVNETGSVTINFYYNTSDAEKAKGITAKNKELKTNYGAELDLYKENQEAVDLIKLDIYSVYNEINKKYWQMDDMKRKYETYLDLADGNAKTAMKFLKNAYSIDEQTEYYVQGKKMPIIS